ncbi:hypothetical protein MJO28_015709 [Puccinia striiformis f. sp. tritici]|uniref:Uncharacterized protein n=1 Tax=Puccinia striiformis f. sp. tritici TaxID=168172 RepID=A0ACC0DRF4_9BASI|nr:hypothetical protein MJO28_015709 [Puccinia striiformis f. sp. tritici]
MMSTPDGTLPNHLMLGLLVIVITSLVVLSWSILQKY